jgi:hypothetical protein
MLLPVEADKGNGMILSTMNDPPGCDVTEVTGEVLGSTGEVLGSTGEVLGSTVRSRNIELVPASAK